VAGKLVSGWGVNGVTTLQNGFPLHLSTAQNLTGSLGGGSRPNYNLAACPDGPALSGSAESRLTRWFNTGCFTQPAAFTYGNLGRNLSSLRAHGIANFDFSVFKTTTLGRDGRVGLQFRSEFFNLFNRTQFNYPGQALGVPAFGVVNAQYNNPRLIQLALRLSF
jgi:hypothetical protein